MKDFFKNKIVTILILVATLLLAGVAIFTAIRLYQLRQESVAPTAPESRPGAATTCNEQCPGPDGILRNCHPPDTDGTSQDSICNAAGRVESCGGAQYCCPAAGGTWTTDMSKCPTPGTCTQLTFTLGTTTTPTPTTTQTPTPTTTTTPTPTPTATPTATPTTTTTTTPTATTTATPTLPVAGVSTPTLYGLGIGTILIILSIILAF